MNFQLIKQTNLMVSSLLFFVYILNQYTQHLEPLIHNAKKTNSILEIGIIRVIR